MTVLRARALDAQGNPVVGRTAVLEAWTGNRYQSPYNGPRAVRGIPAVSASDGWMQWTLPALQRRPGPRGTLWVITGLEASPIVIATQPGDTTTTGVRVGTISLTDGSFVPTPVTPVDTGAEAAAAAQAAVSAVTAGAPLSLDTLAEIAAVLNGRLADTALKTGYAAADMPSSLPAGTVLAHRYDPLRQAYNANPDTLRRWLSALARMKATGGTPARVNVVGHSYVVGTATSPRHTGSFATKLRDLFNAKYGSAGTGIVHLVTTSISDDPRIVFTGSWAAALGTRGAFNAAAYNATGTANKIAFTPDIPVDSFTVYYGRNINGGIISASVDGGTAVTVDSHLSGSEALGALVVPATGLGTHTLTITAPATSQAYIMAVEGTVGSSGVRVSRVGRSGATVSTITTAGSTGADSMATIFQSAPDLTIVLCQVNDYLSAIPLATYIANLTTLVNRAKQYGDVLVIADPNVQTQPNATTGLFQSAYHAALYGLADSLGFAVLDIAARWKDYPTAVAVPPGFMAAPAQDASGVHPYYVGHQDIANAIFAVIDAAPVVPTSAQLAADPALKAAFVPFDSYAYARNVAGSPPPPPPQYKVIDTFQAGHAWTFANNDAASNLNLTDSAAPLGTQYVRAVTTGAGGPTPVRVTRSGMAPTLDMTGRKFALLMRITNVQNLDNIFIYAGSAGFAAYNLFQLDRYVDDRKQAFFREGEWAWFVCGHENLSVVTGTPPRNAYVDLRIAVVDKGSGAKVTTDIAAIASVPEPASYPSGVVSLVFDDNWATQDTIARPILDKYLFRGTYYVIADAVGTQALGREGSMSLTTLQRLQSAGHEIAAHSSTLANHNLANGFKDLTAAQLDAEHLAMKSWLKANGFRGYEHLAYPQGSYNPTVLDRTRAWYTSARTMDDYARDNFPPDDPHRLRANGLDNAITLATMKARVDATVAGKGWLIIVCHRLDPVTTDSLTWKTSDYQSLIDYVAASGAAVRPVGQVLASR